MKRFIIISLLAAAMLPMKACLWLDNHNYYLFSAYNHLEFQERVNKVCDIYRMENGMLAEHWDVVQHLDPDQVPANGNGQF